MLLSEYSPPDKLAVQHRRRAGQGGCCALLCNSGGCARRGPHPQGSVGRAAAAQQAQQAAQDPVIQMQAKELELKKAEEERKTKKDLMDAAAQADKIAIDEEKIKSAERIAGAQIGAKTAKDQNEMEFKKLQEGIKVGQTLAQSNKPQTGSKE